MSYKNVMKKISTITFHASYNYGSCLQAYALQEYIKKIEKNKCEYKIINLRTKIQKEMYKNCFEKKDYKNNFKKIIFFREKKDIINKKNNFESFINEKLNLTKEYNSLDEIKKDNLISDYYIAGSDQLWNLQAKDFDWTNFLEFTENREKNIICSKFWTKSSSLE